MSLEERQVEKTCDVHGVFSAKQIRLRPTEDWWPVRCGQCEDEKQKREEAEILARTIREQTAARKRRIELAMRGSAIPERFNGRTFANYQSDSSQKKAALERCVEYANEFESHRKNGCSMIMTGLTGTGKTHLACSIAHHIITEFAMAPIYCTAGKALRMVKDTYRKDSEKTEIEMLSFFTAPDLLIIDEIGVQYGSDAEKNILFDIINERYEKMLPTILISNLALDKLKDYVGDRIVDRMRENGGKLMVFDWKSHRGAN